MSVVQAEGEALVMPLDTFIRLFESEPQFQRAVLAYFGALLSATSQSVVCNRFHDLTARTARWLLLMHDRIESDEFRLTHSFMGLMLGVHRPAVTVALRTLSEAGIVQQSARGQLRILDRTALEDAACECYERARGVPTNTMGA
jgi:CRP-like cAMP-binding protein